MKNTIAILILLLSPFFIQAQAHLGVTLSDIKSYHPENTFKLDYTTDHTLFASADIGLGTYSYYFNDNGVSTSCIMIPRDLQSLNTQTEIYNKKYTIISKTSWRAYLDGGSIMNIRLTYNEQYKLYMFRYENAD